MATTGGINIILKRRDKLDFPFQCLVRFVFIFDYQSWLLKALCIHVCLRLNNSAMYSTATSPQLYPQIGILKLEIRKPRAWLKSLYNRQVSDTPEQTR